MKVLLINGSSRIDGCTYTALFEVASELRAYGIESEIVNLGVSPIRDCIACGKCRQLQNNRCVFGDDVVNEILEKSEDMDAFIFGSPVYYAHPSGRILSVLDRVFYAGTKLFAHKPAAAVLSARRAGTTASFDVLNKYFTIAQMPVVSSTYWNMVHGSKADEVKLDLEGLQTMRNLAHNMAWLLRCIELGRNEGVNPPVAETAYRTNFIR